MARVMMLGVIGDSVCGPAVARLAEEVGREVSRRGAILICGGLGGVMEAACRGAKAEGGTTVGILPGNDAAEANPHVDIPVVTGMGEARNVLVVKSSDALVAVAGSYGTLSEIAIALKLGRPVVGLDTWELRRGGHVDGGLVVAGTPAQAVELALKLARAAKRVSGGNA